jgi:hypothetical protein
MQSILYFELAAAQPQLIVPSKKHKNEFQNSNGSDLSGSFYLISHQLTIRIFTVHMVH